MGIGAPDCGGAGVAARVLAIAPGIAPRTDRRSKWGSVLPVTRRLRLRRIQDRIASSNERIEPVRLGLGPLDPLLLLGRELAAVACSVLDGRDELAQAVCALQPARVAKQGKRPANPS